MNAAKFGTILLFFWLISVGALSVVAQNFRPETVPDPKTNGGGYVSDPNNLLGQGFVDRMNRTLAALEDSTTVQVAVVCLKDIDAEFTPKTFATELLNRWGVGKENNNGIVMLIVIDQRRTEVETGYGIEGVLPDVLVSQLLESELVPDFKEGKYGDGTYDFIRAMTQVIYDPESAKELTAAGDSTYSTSDEEGGNIVFSLFFGFLYGMALIFASPDASLYKAPKDGSPHYSPARRPKWLSWVLFGWGPALWTLNWGFADMILGSRLFDPFGFLPSMALIWVSLVLLVLDYRIRDAKFAINHWEDPYHAVQHLRKLNAHLWLQVIVFAPIMLPFYFWLEKQKKNLRKQKRVSLKTGEPMRLLSEKEEDAYLQKGRQMEEELRSVDYDVWITDSGDDILILPYERSQLEYSKCFACQYTTRKQTGTKIIQSATYESTGYGERNYICRNCGKNSTESYSIAKKVKSSSSSSGSSWGSGSGSSSRSGGGSSGGSSWGGGSSGGGGAGASW